jgi:hypothetical protein
MKRVLQITLACMLAASSSLAESRLTVGAGAHYWRTINEIGDERAFDDSGVAYMLSLQCLPARLLRFEGDVEIFPDGFAGSTDAAYAPQAFVIVGSTIFAGLGVGTVYSSQFESDFSEAFYVVRAGFALELLPSIYLEINGNYHFVNWEDIDKLDDNLDGDTITLGAMLRIML